MEYFAGTSVGKTKWRSSHWIITLSFFCAGGVDITLSHINFFIYYLPQFNLIDSPGKAPALNARPQPRSTRPGSGLDVWQQIVTSTNATPLQDIWTGTISPYPTIFNRYPPVDQHFRRYPKRQLWNGKTAREADYHFLICSLVYIRCSFAVLYVLRSRLHTSRQSFLPPNLSRNSLALGLKHTCVSSSLGVGLGALIGFFHSVHRLPSFFPLDVASGAPTHDTGRQS